MPNRAGSARRVRIMCCRNIDKAGPGRPNRLSLPARSRRSLPMCRRRVFSCRGVNSDGSFVANLQHRFENRGFGPAKPVFTVADDPVLAQVPLAKRGVPCGSCSLVGSPGVGSEPIG